MMMCITIKGNKDLISMIATYHTRTLFIVKKRASLINLRKHHRHIPKTDQGCPSTINADANKQQGEAAPSSNVAPATVI
jgi:hypothetical protein